MASAMVEHDSQEHDRRNHHADEVEEGVAQRPHGSAGAGREHAEQDAERDGNEDPYGEVPAQPSETRRRYRRRVGRQDNG